MSGSSISETEINSPVTETEISAAYPSSRDTSSISSNDLWLTILNCHRSQDPPRALINASRSSLRPILTILATCYEVFYFNN